MWGLMRKDKIKTLILSLLATAVVAPNTASAQEIATETFDLAPLGLSILSALEEDDPLVGKEVVSARFYIDFEAFPGADAANLITDYLLPIEPLPGGTSFFLFTGADHGWSGSGTFSYFEETDRFNGTFVSGFYASETTGLGPFEGGWLDNARIEIDYVVPEPTTVVLLLGGAGLVVARRRGQR